MQSFYSYGCCDDFFNWTVTYRPFSDIPALYDKVVPKVEGVDFHNTKFDRKKFNSKK